MKFTIDRTKWLRGESNSRLFRSSDGKMCCIGQVCEQLGIPCAVLRDVITTYGLPEHFVDKFRAGIGALSTHAAYSINDSRNIDDLDRERRLTAKFADAGHEIEFVN